MNHGIYLLFELKENTGRIVGAFWNEEAAVKYAKDNEVNRWYLEFVEILD